MTRYSVAVPLLFVASAHAVAASLCPESVTVKQTGSAPSSLWSVSYSPTAPSLETMTFFSGPPKDEASLVYDRIEDAKDASVATWTFPKDPRGYWVKCAYRGTTVELSRPLPSTVSSCRVTYDRQPGSPGGLPAIKRVACQ